MWDFNLPIKPVKTKSYEKLNPFNSNMNFTFSNMEKEFADFANHKFVIFIHIL